jgi:hypothetical protein
MNMRKLLLMILCTLTLLQPCDHQSAGTSPEHVRGSVRSLDGHVLTIATDLQPGTHVFVVAHRTSGSALAADRVLAGKNGTVAPM